VQERSVIGQIIFVKILFFKKRNNRGDFVLFGKNTGAEREVNNVSYIGKEYTDIV